ncbi:MAG: hypothetical protein HQL06_10270 [Nitrospirae bacterium]|nr:hypothetical protein [Nitrospirota bacterium]
MLSQRIINVAKVLRFYASTKSLTIFMLLLFGLTACAQQFKTPMFQPFDSKGWGPNAMAYNGRDLLIGDRDTVFTLNNIRTGPYSTIHDLFTSDGRAMLSRFPVPLPKLFTICGMAWEGECCEDGFLWVADSQNKELVKIEFNSNHIIKTFKTPGQAPHGLTFDGQNLWLADVKESKIYKISAEDGSVMEEFNSPVKRPAGLAWDCESLWVVGYDTCRHVTEECQSPKLVKLDIKSGKVTQAIHLPQAINRPSALQWMKGNLWVADYNLNRVFIAYDPYDVDDNTNYRTEISVKKPETSKTEPDMTPAEQLEELPPLQFEPNPAAEQVKEPTPVPTTQPVDKHTEQPKPKKLSKKKQKPQEGTLPDK